MHVRVKKTSVQRGLNLLLFICCLMVGACLLFSSNSLAMPGNNSPSALVMEVKGGIGPGQQRYITQGLASAKNQAMKAVVIKLDTPGGLGSSMRAIVSAILASPVPVIVYVSPSGARAASAGTYIMYAAHIAAMAPGTNLGAASPVAMTMPGSPSQPNKSDSDKSTASVSEKKAVNDSSAYIRSLAELRGRNVSWAEKAVRQAASISANQALRMGVIDVVAKDVQGVLNQINGKTVLVQGKPQLLNTKQLKLVPFNPNWQTKFLRVITDPSMAYILLMIGVWGLFFEFSNPGAVVPGVIGGVSLLVAMYALQLLPINYVGLLLIVLGISFLIAEAFLASFGVLGIGGIVALAIGSTMLIDADMPGFAIAIPVIFVTSMLTAGFFLLVVNLALRSRFRPIVSGAESLIGQMGLIEKDFRGRMWVRVQGELWKLDDAARLNSGDKVVVTQLKGCQLSVKKQTK